jgi:hypothetical protein
LLEDLPEARGTTTLNTNNTKATEDHEVQTWGTLRAQRTRRKMGLVRTIGRKMAPVIRAWGMVRGGEIFDGVDIL